MPVGLPASGDAPFWLELGGSALRSEYPLERRKLHGTEAGLTVGRSYQAQLLNEAVRNEVMQFLSRDHFRVEPSGGRGQYQFAPLSSNPMWIVRAGERLAAKKGQAIPLQPGDAILLYTGASDCTADGPGNNGTLYWNFCDPKTPLPEFRNPLDVVAPAPAPAPAPRPHRPIEFKSECDIIPVTSTGAYAADGSSARMPVARLPGSSHGGDGTPRQASASGGGHAQHSRLAPTHESAPRKKLGNSGVLKAPVAGLHVEEEDEKVPLSFGDFKVGF